MLPQLEEYVVIIVRLMIMELIPGVYETLERNAVILLYWSG